MIFITSLENIWVYMLRTFCNTLGVHSIKSIVDGEDLYCAESGKHVRVVVRMGTECTFGEKQVSSRMWSATRGGREGGW